MRYDRQIFFVRELPGDFLYDTGDYQEGDVSEISRYASVMNTRTESLGFIYGSIRQGSLVLQLPNYVTEDFDYIRIGDKRYKVDYRRRLRSKETFVVSEVV